MMIKNKHSKSIAQLLVLALLTFCLICIVIFLSIRIIDLNEAKKLPVDELLQQYWLEQYVETTTTAQLEADKSSLQDQHSLPSSDTGSADAMNADNSPARSDDVFFIENENSDSDILVVTDVEELNSNFKDETNKIDINSATIQQLQSLKGIGPSKAQAIVDDRVQKGKFNRIEDIKRVKGIGEKLYAGIQESIVAIQ